jgi:hypothetical protein
MTNPIEQNKILEIYNNYEKKEKTIDEKEIDYHVEQINRLIIQNANNGLLKAFYTCKSKDARVCDIVFKKFNKEYNHVRIEDCFGFINHVKIITISWNDIHSGK